MKLPRFLSIALLITSFSLLYVWQQTEIIRLAYLGQKNQVLFQELLDKNSVLRYNLKRSTSLINIGSRILGSNDFQIPETYCLVKMATPEGKPKSPAKNTSKPVQMLARIFGIKRQAEAYTTSNFNSASLSSSKYLEPE